MDKDIKEKRDGLIRQLWLVFRDMSDIYDAEKFTDEDLELWGLVTGHSAVQDRLKDPQQNEFLEE